MGMKIFMLEFRCDSMNSVVRKIVAYKTLKAATIGIGKRFGYNGGDDMVLSIYNVKNLCTGNNDKRGSLVARRYGNNSNKGDWEISRFSEIA